jgi:hypothetical protein
VLYTKFVKNSCLRLRRDFLPDINKNLKNGKEWSILYQAFIQKSNAKIKASLSDFYFSRRSCNSGGILKLY